MNKKELLLACLLEELSEVQQEISKCQRFTAGHLYEPYGTTNLERVQLEYADVCAVAYLLRQEGIETYIMPPSDPGLPFIDRYFDKMSRTEASYKVSIELGALQE
jgi:hypothetical protein